MVLVLDSLANFIQNNINCNSVMSQKGWRSLFCVICWLGVHVRPLYVIQK